MTESLQLLIYSGTYNKHDNYNNIFFLPLKSSNILSIRTAVFFYFLGSWSCVCPWKTRSVISMCSGFQSPVMIAPVQKSSTQRRQGDESYLFIFFF